MARGPGPVSLGHPVPRHARAALVAVVAAGVYLLGSYGGIRSPDSEIVFRSSLALATEGTLAVGDDLPWQGFGLAPGRDGHMHSVFGPGLAVLWAPWTAASLHLNRTGWYRTWPLPVPLSHYVGVGGAPWLRPVTPAERAQHAHRFLAVLPYPLVSAFTVGLFLGLARRLSGSTAAATAAALLLGFGTLVLPYSGTFLTEPLTTLLCLGSVACAVRARANAHGGKWALASGSLLGLGVTVHVTAVLFAPFFLAVAALGPGWRLRWRDAAAFSVGLGVWLAALGLANQARFGDPLETGRTVVDAHLLLGYGAWASPWQGLAGLLVCPGKGLLLFCPALLLAVPAWSALTRRDRVLGWSLLGAAVFRLGFVASRTDWHGGFCLGPRLLVPLLPLLLLPVACWVVDSPERTVRRTRLGLVVAIAAACSCQQLYFTVGEPFSFLHHAKWALLEEGVNPFIGNAFYLGWRTSPLAHLVPGRLGPWPLAAFGPGGGSIWIVLSVLAGGLAVVVHRRLQREAGSEWACEARHRNGNGRGEPTGG